MMAVIFLFILLLYLQDTFEHQIAKCRPRVSGVVNVEITYIIIVDQLRDVVDE